MPTYKLSYFDIRGRAEIARLIFAYAQKEFEDIRVAGEEWAALKPKTPFGQMPVLDVDGQLIGQSVAIANFLAREFGLYGKTNMESCQIDQIVCNIQDYIADAVKVHFEKDETKKAELKKVFTEETVPKHLGIFEKMLEKNGSGCFIGSDITLADLFVYDFTWNLLKNFSTALDNFPLVKANHDKVASVPQIKSYVDARKPTDM